MSSSVHVASSPNQRILVARIKERFLSQVKSVDDASLSMNENNIQDVHVPFHKLTTFHPPLQVNLCPGDTEGLDIINERIMIALVLRKGYDHRGSKLYPKTILRT